MVARPRPVPMRLATPPAAAPAQLLTAPGAFRAVPPAPAAAGGPPVAAPAAPAAVRTRVRGAGERISGDSLWRRGLLVAPCGAHGTDSE